ncbi:hypothetical protein EC973_001919 [Apophysomyces ossiformis]|uniref:Chalcone isomerase domain-containing protein n=1 Tax=Apophysomyces ossiformis TaxID=679940 RepID=A0A8H7BXZ6_9FUNG|nr:hypothetical protein EC973_001919 [Apophysomyces ossiformis]
MALGSATVGLAAMYFTCDQKIVYAEAANTGYAGTVEEPETKISFPVYLNVHSEWKRLIGLGVRQVSFLNINVYVVGLYMRDQDMEKLRALEGWKNFDKSEFLGNEELATGLLEQPYDITVRVVPNRATNTQHLRDGFTRSLLTRMREQSKDLTEEQEAEILDGIRDFKSRFASANVKKDTEFIFTKTKEGGLRMEFEGKDLGTVQCKWLAINFVMGYLNPKAPASELARQDIANGFEKLLNEE